MLKKKYKLKNQLYIKVNYTKLYLVDLLSLSLKKNHFIDPLNRISYFGQEDFRDNMYYKFSTFQKLLCLNSLSPKVPNKAYLYSRFFLNKQVDKLFVSNTFK